MFSYSANAPAETQYLSPFDARWEAIAANAQPSLEVERRASERHSVSLPVTVFCAGKTNKSATRNLSSTGLAVQGRVGIEGEPCMVILHITLASGSSPLTLAARCVRVSGELTGFEFHAITDIDRLTLAETLDHLRALPTSRLM